MHIYHGVHAEVAELFTEEPALSFLPGVLGDELELSALHVKHA